MTEKRRLAAILAADATGYSRLMAENEDRTIAALDLSRGLFKAAIAAAHGRVVDMAGDSVLAVFDSAAGAVAAAIDVQKQLAAALAAVPDDQRMQFRIGVHLGDITEKDDGTVYGDGVNIAARIQSLAEPGGVAVSQEVQGVVRGKIAVTFEDRGEHAAKNIAHPIRMYYVRIGAAASAHARAPAPTLPDKPSIAVLPFTNMSGDPEQDYFADGIVEDIITALSRFKELFVIARNSTFVYKGKAVDIQQVARDLGVRYVLEGSVRKAGNRVRITGQLIEAATRAHLWAERYDGALEEVFELQDRISESVAGALGTTLTTAEIERAQRKPPASLDAYDYLLRATPLVIANSSEDAEAAIKLLAEALRLNPEYARAHAYTALCNAMIFRAATGPARDLARANCIAHGRRAVELAGDDSTALAYAGFALLVGAQDVATARASLDKAVALNPNHATAYGYRALVLSMGGDPHQAIQDANRALRLSPLDPGGYQPQMALVVANVRLRRYDEAVGAAHQAIQLAPPRYPMSYAWLMVAECGRGDVAEAERQMKRLAQILPGFTPAMVPNLFEVFPEPLRSDSIGALRNAGLVPGG
jgi:adenylate cyclase